MKIVFEIFAFIFTAKVTKNQHNKGSMDWHSKHVRRTVGSGAMYSTNESHVISICVLVYLLLSIVLLL